MFPRILGIAILTIGLTFGVIGVGHAGQGGNNQGGNQGGNNQGGNNQGGNQGGNNQGNGDSSAPELDPTALASGIALLTGGVLLLNERRRKNR